MSNNDPYSKRLESLFSDTPALSPDASAPATPQAHARSGAIPTSHATDEDQTACLDAQRFFEMAADLLCIISPDGRFHRVSAACEPTLGWTPAEMTKRLFLELVHPDDVAATMAEFEKLARGAAVIHVDNRYRGKNGLYRRLAWRAQTGIDGLLYATARSVSAEAEVRQANYALPAGSENGQGAEAQLAEWRTLFSAMTDVILILDAQGRYLRIAPTNPSLLLKPTADLLGKTFYDVMPAAQAETLVSCIREALADQKSVRTQYALPINGQETWFEATVAPLTPATVAWIARDITDHKRAEETLAQHAAEVEETRGFLEAVFESLPVGMFMKDAQELRFVRWNKANEELIGLRRDEVIGKNDSDFFPEEEANWFTAKDRDVLARGELVDIPEETVQTAHKGQRILHTRKVAIRGVDGKPKYLLGISEDITERKQAEESLTQRAAELQDATAFLDSVIENLPTMLFVKEAEDLRFVRWNQAGEDLLGFSREAMIGKNDYDFFPKEEADFFTQKDREVLAGGALIDIPEEPIQTAHRGLRFLHTRKIPIYDAQGKPKYLLGISEDITERSRAEAALIKRAEREQLINHITSRLRSAQSVEQMMQIAAQELRQATQASRSVARIAAQNAPGESAGN